MTSTRAPFLAVISAAPRRARRIVERADQIGRALDEHQRLPLIPGVIAERDGVRTPLDQVPVDGLGDAEPAGGVLAVDDHAVELPVGDEAGQPLVNDHAPAAPDNVSNEKDAHASVRNRGSQ